MATPIKIEDVQPGDTIRVTQEIVVDDIRTGYGDHYRIQSGDDAFNYTDKGVAKLELVNRPLNLPTTPGSAVVVRHNITGNASAWVLTNASGWVSPSENFQTPEEFEQYLRDHRYLEHEVIFTAPVRSTW